MARRGKLRTLCAQSGQNTKEGIRTHKIDIWILRNKIGISVKFLIGGWQAKRTWAWVVLVGLNFLMAGLFV